MLGLALNDGLGAAAREVEADEIFGLTAVVPSWLVAMFVMRRNTPGLAAAGFSLAVSPAFGSTAGFKLLLATLNLFQRIHR